MIKWIDKTIYPPGIEKPNRLALFSVVGEVMSRVRKDAEKAFYAHFPYLADDKKLNEHGEALLIPHLPNDTPEEYRNRVATASFFLMKAGERAYIMDQLQKRFGDRFVVIEKFLSIHTKITELSDDERVWVLSLFDSLVDPNIYLELSELYNFIDKVLITEEMRAMQGQTAMLDQIGNSVFRYGVIRRNGQYRRGYFGIKDDAGISLHPDLQDKLYARPSRSGIYRRDGTIKRNGIADVLASEQITADLRLENVDRIALAEQFDYVTTQSWTDTLDKEVKRNGVHRRNGSVTRGKSAVDIQGIEVNALFVDTVAINESFSIGYRTYNMRNGVHQRNGKIKRNNNVFIPITD